METALNGYAGPRYGDTIIPRMDGTMVDVVNATPATRNEIDSRLYIMARCPIKGDAYIRGGSTAGKNGTFVYFDTRTPKGQPITLEVQIPTHYLYLDRDDCDENMKEIGKLIGEEYKGA